jgi:hypothetical protein
MAVMKYNRKNAMGKVTWNFNFICIMYVKVQNKFLQQSEAMSALVLKRKNVCRLPPCMAVLPYSVMHSEIKPV